MSRTDPRAGSAAAPALPAPEEVRSLQRRTVRVLVTSQVLGGVGVSSGISVGALLASRVLGREDLAGLVQSAQVLGAALLALPTARLALTRGRRWGLATGYGLAVLGAVLAVLAAELRWFPLLLLGTALFGGGTAAGLQSRYAATDLAAPTSRGRALSVVVWSTTIGAVAGPNLVGPAGRLAAALGIEPLAGPFLLGGCALALASLVVAGTLRPDPLALARRLAGEGESPHVAGGAAGGAAGEAAGGATGGATGRAAGGATGGRVGAGRRRGAMRHGLAAASHSGPAVLGLLAVVVAHTVMVAVMVMTPIHMDHGGASLEVIGLVISLHVAGMFAFSPVMGWLADRVGRVPVIVGGAAVLLAAVALSGTSPEGSSPGLGAGLFLLGLGWSACLVAGSVLITDALPVADRPAAQGASDLLMGLAAAAGGALAGLVVGTLGYAVLNLGASVLVLVLLGAAGLPACRPPSNTRSV
ncbi:MAG TPA: MFS transporter [Jiangellales bacterium]|nr:MFS transporter [Jiangellales bacterium]